MEEVDSEKVIFVEETKQVHCLALLAAVVFDHCDGKTSPTELARIAGDRLDDEVTEEHVQEALAQLEERGLLASPLPITISRREMVRKSAVVGAAAAAAVTLISTVEPPMALAVNCSGQVCSRTAQCSFGGCGTKTCTCSSHTCQCV
jgi:hypothetical protein